MEYIPALQTLSARYQEIIQADQATEHANVEDYRALLVVLANRYKSVKVPEPLLTIPRIFGRTHDENFISDYLAYILDPAKNGLGSAPLETFLGLCQIDFNDIPIEHAHVRREYSLEDGRIDLLIECEETLVVGVENKIFSPEGGEQTRYYERVMDRDFGEIPHHLVFLTRSGYPASSEKAIRVSYAALWEALKKVPVTALEDRRKSVLWEDFLEHLEVYIMSNKSNPDHFEFSDKAKLFIENFAMLTDLAETYKQERKDAIAFIETRLSEAAGEGWVTNFPTSSYCQQLYKPGWMSKQFNIHFEWWFNFDPRENRTMKGMIDVEGKMAEEPLALFDVQHKKIEKMYAQRGIEYRPSKRRIAIALKEYPIGTDINKVADQFIESFNDLRFLEPVIDEVSEALSKKA